MEFPSAIFGPRTDEGRAMLQIVHDVAPDATLLFGSGFLSESDHGKKIRRLAKPINPSDPNDPTAGYGANVVVDDVSYLTSPFFQKGAISKAIDDVTTLYGAKYFTSAGNYGKKAYEAFFDGINPLNARTSHKFGINSLTGQPDSLQEIKLNKKGSYLIVTQWEAPYYSLGGSGTNTDIDVYICDKYGNNVLGYNWNNTNTDGLEVLPFYVDGPTTIYLKIVRASTTASLPQALRFKHIIFRGSAEIMTYPNQTHPP